MNDELQATNEELRDRTTEIFSINQFMESILGSLRAGVVVVDRDLLVKVWNKQAEDMWGLREDETVGQHLLNIDSGLPVEQLKPLVREVINEGRTDGEVVLPAVNRRGRHVQLRVVASPLSSQDGQPTGALLLLDQMDDAQRD